MKPQKRPTPPPPKTLANPRRVKWTVRYPDGSTTPEANYVNQHRPY